ncbi:cation:proton antiporter subunit C [Parvularcula sp. ZS-1/3]|uniref:Cation:proton antiporter subunit C n=1 Tax=Parvularcula mediterranea TaxID=2732508 RepID=A0A7Y3RNQ0_9PROT|nr:cation:proton antiporter subunit C [Parvularcula mediterranea]NNU16617.1 cation:proton antiporter subunit C [Parvularcula mediterranea]
MLEFILARYNYWIVICLMMTGLYIVFSRGNLVKTLVGLNLFQTSVFIFYITIGKVIGGTAPILIEDKSKKKDDHSGGHDAHSADHQSASEAPVGFFPEGQSASPDSSAMHDDAGAAEGYDAPVNQLTGVRDPGAAQGGEGSLHLQPEGAPANELLPNVLTDNPDHTADIAKAAGGATEILYSNPLPHVLILTAIVVGVATTAVGLSLAVRIREAYGTVEEDQLETLDNEAERREVARA